MKRLEGTTATRLYSPAMRNVAQIAILLFSATVPSALAQPAQNVILITMDGVRYKDIFRPEPDAPYLDHKKGFPLARFHDWAIRQNGGFAFGTQEPGDEMETGNTTSLSLPGYKALMSGLYESVCEDNHCGKSRNETIVDRILRHTLNPRSAAVFSSWSRIINAAESSSGAVQSMGFQPLTNFRPETDADRAFVVRQSRVRLESRKKANLPPWSSGRWDPYDWARFDRYTWALGTDYLKTYHPRLLWISLLDTDEYAHRDEREQYHRALSAYDDWLLELVQQLQSPAHGEYLRNTSIVITTDHGRGGDSGNFSDHGPNFFNYTPPGSENIWAYIVPSLNLREKFELRRSQHGVQNKYSQLDLRPTMETLLGLPPRAGTARGTPLLLFRKKAGK